MVSAPLPIWNGRLLLVFVQVQRSRIDAVTLTSWTGPIVKNVPEVRAAAAAGDFCPQHAVGSIFGFVDDGVRARSGKTGPTATRVIFRFGTKKLLAAGDALIRAGRIGRFVFARKWRLSSLFPSHIVLIRRELLLPLRFRFLNFLCHEELPWSQTGSQRQYLIRIRLLTFHSRMQIMEGEHSERFTDWLLVAGEEAPVWQKLLKRWNSSTLRSVRAEERRSPSQCASVLPIPR